MNKQKPIATDISQWNNCTEIIYKCPRCGQEFPTKNLTYPKKENNFSFIVAGKGKYNEIQTESCFRNKKRDCF